MRLVLAALLIASALTAYAQTPPESPPSPSSQAAPAPDQPSDSEQVEQQPAPRPPRAVRTPAARPQAQPPALPTAAPAAAAHPAGQYEQQLQELRAQVSRLQSELDTERAAALQATEELSGAQTPRGVWGWLAVAAVLALAAGFVLGWRVLDRRIRRKYGGLRIY